MNRLKPLLERRAAHELSLEMQRPTMIHFARAVVGLADDLSGRGRRQRAFRRVVVAHAVGGIGRIIVLHKKGVHVTHLVQRVGYRTQFVEMDDAHHRVMHLGSYTLCKAVGVVEVQEILCYHAAKLRISKQNAK